MKLRGVKTFTGAGIEEFTIISEILVVTSVKSVIATLGFSTLSVTRARLVVGSRSSAEFKSEESILAPGHGRIDMDFILASTQVSETLTSS